MRILKEIRAALDNYQVKSGIYHFYRGEYPQAIQFFGRALLAGERLSEADAGIARDFLTHSHLSAAEEAEAEEDFEKAVEQLSAAAAVNDRFPDIRFRLARAQEHAGLLPEAIENYRRAVALNPRYLEARTALAFALLATGLAEEASEEFQEIFKETVAGIARPYREGLSAIAARDMAQAARCLRDAFFNEPWRLADFVRDALGHLRAERWQEAVGSLREALALSPGFADLHNYLGVALAESGQRDEALACFRESVRLNPRYSIARLNLAYALSAGGDSREAEDLLEDILSLEPGNSAALARLEEIRSSRVDPRRLEVRRTGRGQAE